MIIYPCLKKFSLLAVSGGHGGKKIHGEKRIPFHKLEKEIYSLRFTCVSTHIFPLSCIYSIPAGCMCAFSLVGIARI